MKRLNYLILSSLITLSFNSYSQALIGSTTQLSTIGTDGDTNVGSSKSAVAYSSSTEEYLVVWSSDNTDNDFGIYGQFVNGTTGVEVGTDFAIVASTASEDHQTPSVVYNPTSDEFLVVWSAFISPTSYIYAQRVDEAGTLQGSLVTVASSSSVLSNPDVSFSATSDVYLVAFQNGSNSNVSVQVLDGADASLSGGISHISDLAGGGTNNQQPKIAWNSVQNEFFVVWNTDPVTDDAFEIYGQRLDDTGADIAATSNIKISNVGDGDAATASSNPDVVYNPDDDEYFVVYSADVTDGVFKVYGSVRDNVGAQVVAQTAYSTNGNGTFPQVEYNSINGQYLISFLDIQGTDSEVYGQLVTTAGAETGTDDFEIIVRGSGDSDGLQANPVSHGMTIGRLASYLVVQSAMRITNEYEVFGQLWGISQNNVAITTVDANPTKATTLNFSVDFSLPVTGFSASNLGITVSGVSGEALGTITGSGTSYNVPVDVTTGEGTVRLDMNNTTAIDLVVDNVPYTSGELYDVDLTAPLLLSSLPVASSTNSYPSQDITLTFDDDMAKGTGNILIRELSDDAIAETIDVTSGSVTISTNVVTINPTINLSKGVSYYLEIASGALTNTLITDYAGISGSSTLSFTVADVVINEVVLEPQFDWSPAFDGTDGASLVNSEDDWIELYINSTGVDFSIGTYPNKWIIEVDNGNDGTDYFGDLDVVGANGSGAFDVSNYITSGSGTFNSTEPGDYLVLGNPFGANDLTNPVRITLKDPGGAVVDEVIIGTGGFTDYVSNGVDIGASGTEAAFRRPNGADTDADNIDFFQNFASIGSENPNFPLITNATWLDENPQDGVVDRLQLDFNEAVNITDAGAGFDAITISGGITIDDQDYSDNTGTATSLTLDVSNVSTGTADPGVTVQYDNTGSSTIISVASANEIPHGETPDTYIDAAEPFVLNALTIDSGTPDGTIDEIEIEFSENVTDVDVIPGDFALSTDAGSSSDVFNTRSTDVFSISTDAVANDQYIRLTVTSPTNVTGTGAAQLSYTSTTSIDDAAGNVMSDFVFVAVTDGAAPILLTSTPEDEDIGVPGANDITLNFSETVQAGTGNIEINGTNGPTYDVATASQLTFGSSLVINPDSPLESLNTYNLLVDGTAITDGDGNDFAGLVAGDLNFITQANPPTISSATWLDANPQDGVIDQLRLDFGEAVDIDDQNGGGGFDPIVISGSAITIDNGDYSDLSGTATFLILDVSGVTTGTADPGVTISYSSASSSSITSDAYGLEIVNGTSPSSIVDGALPVIITALTIDDGDGTADAMEIEFSEPILDAGISGVGGFADWTLDDGTNPATPFTGFSTAVTDLASDADGDDQYITLTINAGVSGTGAMSYVYSNTLGDITDASAQANVLADIGSTLANDGAAPIVLNAITLDDGDGDVDALELEFSEPMNEASLSGNFSDWTLNDGTNGAAAFTGFSTQTDVVSGGTVNVASDQYATLTISTGAVGTGVMDYAYGGVAITDNSAQAVALATITATAADDDAAPTIIGYTLEGSNTYLDVNFSEDIYGNDGIIESVKADWTLTFDQNVGGGGTATAAEIGDITTTGDVVIPSNTGVNTIRFNLIFTGNQSGDELIAISPVDGVSVADASPSVNLMSGAQTTGNISVNTVTAVKFEVTSAAATDNSSINLVFSEGVGRNTGGSSSLRYNSSCTGGTVVNELCASFTDPDGLVTVSNFGVSHSGGSATLTFSFDIDSGTPDGNEYFTFGPADGNEIRGGTSGNMQAAESIDVYLTDQLPPTFTSATYYDHDENGYIDEVVIVMSEPIDDSTIDPNDFLIGGTAAIGIVTGGSIQNGIDANTADDNTFTLSANTQGTGGLTIAYTEDAAGTALADATGNAATNDAGITATDLAAPVILSAVTRDADADGEIETIEVTLTEDVDFLTLDAGGADFTVTSPAFVITAAAQNGSNGVDLTLTPSGSTDVDETPTVTLLTGAIADGDANTTDDGDFSITAADGANPYFATLAVNDPNGYINGELMTLDINMEETGLTVTVNLQNLNAALSASQALADDGDGTYSYSLFVSDAMTEAEDIVLPITATDGASNFLVNSTLTVDLDFTAPTVDITPVFTSDLSPALSGSVNDAAATVEVSINGGGPYTATNAGATWSLAQGTITPDLTTNTTYSVTVTATDLAGNATTDATNGEVKIDNTAPTITSINRSNPLVSTTNASTVVFRVTFDEGVKGVDAGDFDISAFTATNTADAPLVSHISGGSVYDITINNISGSGTLALDVSGATITDSLTVSPNAFAGTVGVSQSYEIDQTQPTVLSIVRKDANPTSANTVNFRATFSEPVTNVTADGSDFDVNTSGPTIGAVAVAQVSSSIYDISVAVSGASGDVYIESSAGQDITDLYANNWDDTTVPSETYNIDYTAPSEDASSVSEIGQTATLSVDLDEAGTVYYVVLLSGDAAPATAEDIRDLTNNAASPEASGNLSIPSGASAYETSINLPDPKTGYVVYLALEDLASPNKNITSGSVLPITSGGVTLAAGTLPSDLCLEGPSKTLSDITITEGINNDFRAGTGLTLRLNLPSGFEYDQTATVTTTGSTLNDISAVSFSYPASNTLQVTYTVGSTTGADELVISGIEVQAVGGSAYASANIERGGGNAVIFGAEGTDDPVLGTVSSVVRPSATSVQYGGSTVTNFRITPGKAFSITAIGGAAGGTYNWYDDDGSLPITGATVTNTDLNALTGFDGTTPDVYRLYSSTTDPAGCESDLTEFLIGVLEFTNSANTVSFTEDSDPTTLTMTEPTGWDGIFYGAGLGATTSSSNVASVVFNPSLAGADGSPHTISYELTDGSVTFEFDTLFTVSSSTSGFLVVAGTQGAGEVSFNTEDYCDNGSLVTFDIRQTTLDDIDAAGFYFTRLVGTGISQPGGYVDESGGGANVVQHATSTGWGYDPNGLTANDYGIRLLGKPKNGLTSTTESVLGNVEFTVYPEPTATLLNISTYYCEDDDAFTIQGGTNDVINGTQTGDITTGYILQKFDGSVFQNYHDFTGVSNDFDPSDPDGDNNRVEDETGTYRIVWVTEELTPGNCTSTVTSSSFEIRTKESAPVLDLTSSNTDGLALSDFGGFDGSEYVFEFCSGTEVPDIKINTTSSPSDVNFALANNTYSWYQSGVGIADGNKLFSTFDAKELFGGTNSPTGNIETDFYVTRTVNSCESDSVMITIRVYADQSQPDIDDTDVSIFASGQDYIFEYCGEPSATISYAALNIVSDLEDPSDRAFVENRSYFRIYDNTAMNEIDQISQGESFTILLDGGLIGATTTASASFSGTVTTEFYISKVVADSSFLDGSAPFVGCESALTKITANIHTYPDVLDVYDLDASYDNADVATYYMCSEDILNNIQTPGASGTTYNWYLDDGSGTQPDYGAPVTVDGNDGRFATQANLETAGGYDFDTPNTYEFWVTQTTDKNLSTGFSGCEGDALKVEVVSYPDPDVVTFDANTLRTYEISFCQGELSGETFPITASNDALFKYYISNPSANKASAATTLFAGDIDADGMVEISTEDLLLQNATQTGGFDDGDNSVGTYYYLISQTNNIDPDGAVDDLGESFEGCESEVSDMAYLTVHVYDIPNAPTTSSGDKLFGEDEVDASGITVTGEGNAGEVFNWYEDLDEDGEPDGTAIFQGSMATSTDLSLAGTLGNDRYKFLVTQTQDIDGSVTGFAGCESDYLEIYVFEVPPATSFTQPDPVCEEDAILGFADISYAGEARNTGLSNGVGLSVFRWYDEDKVLQDESTAISNPELTSIKSIDLEDFVLNGFAGGGITSGIDTTIYFSQVLFKDATINSEVFSGTESELIPITLTAYPQPLEPVLDGDGVDANEYNFCEGIALADLSSAENTISIDVINSGAQYVWYFDLNLNNVIDTANSITLAQLNDETLDGDYFNISDDIEFEDVYSIYVTEVNSIIGGFEGCEGEAKEILIHIQPKAEDYQFFDTDLNEDVDDGDAYCYDYGTLTIGADIVVDGADDENADGVFSINTGGLVDNGDGTATLTTQDMAAAVSETREGGSSTHIISFTYTSEWGCEETFSQTIVINAHPTLDIGYVGSVGQNNADDQLNNSTVCYDQGIFTIRGKQEGNNASSGDMYLFYAGDTLDVPNGFTSLGNGTARITPAEIMSAIGETNPEGNPSEFEVRFLFEDANSCSNFISQTFEVEPQPTLDIQYETAVVGFSDIGDVLEGSIVCYDEETITVGGEVSYLSGTVLDITQSGDADSVQFTINTGGLTDNGNGTATINLSTAAVSAAGNTGGSEDGLPTSHIVTLFYTDANGCNNEVSHSFTINPLPRLDIQVPDNSPCFDDVTMTLQGRQESGTAQTLTPASSGSFSIYSDEALTTPLTTSGFVDNGDGTASFDPDVIAMDYFGLTYDEVRTGDVAMVYIQFNYTDAAGTSCSNTSETTIISIQPQPNISFRVEQNSSVVLSESLADDRYYVSATGSSLLLAGWDLDANSGSGAPLTDGTFSGGSIGATLNGETTFDPNGTGAKTEIYTSPEDFAVTYSYLDGQSCENTVSKTITVLPVPQFQDLGDGENIINVQACLTQEIKQKVVISNLDALGITIDDLDFTWRAGQEAEYDSLEKRFPDYVKITTIAPDTALIEIDNAQVSPLNDQLNDGYPKLEGNVTFTVTAQYDFATGIAAQGTISPFAISASRVINIGDTPIPRFRWINTTVGNTTSFIMDDLNDSPVDINDIKFEVFTMDDLVTPQATIIKQDGVDGVTVDNIKDDWYYTFSDSGDYLVRVTYNSTSSCEAVEERIVTISDIITLSAGSVYTEDFESGFGGWHLDSVDYVTDDPRVKEGFEAYGEFSDAPSSWELGTTTDFGDLNSTTFWVTDADSSYREDEKSFVYSPAYDFSQMSLPTLAFSYACDMDLRDGVVFQYSTDDGLTWSPLGSYDSNEGATGKNWFNAIGINGDPGSIDGQVIESGVFNQEAYGWNNQGGVPDDEDEEKVMWRAAAHKLDGIDRTGPVRFRFALGSTGGDKTVGTTGGYLAGFAFDDFQIYDRSKLIIVEQFASLGTDASEAVQDTLNSRLDDELRSDALLINYFTDLGSAIDVLNSRNTKDPGARSLYYGISTSPKSVITGQVQENDDSDPVGWNINKFNSVALDEPQFTIGNITIGGDEQHVDISIDSFTSNVDIDSANAELSFRVAIVEKTVAGDLVGEDASMVYRNVLRKMLPSAGGKTYVGAVNEGQTEFGELTFDYSWPISKVFDPNNLAVIVFVQLDKDIDETKGLTRGAILQAKMVDVGNGKIVPDASNITSVLPGKEFSVYPNPTDREFEVELAGMALEEMQWVMYDQAGRQVLNGDIKVGESRKLITTKSLPSGIFMLHIFNENTTWSPKRVIVVH